MSTKHQLLDAQDALICRIREMLDDECVERIHLDVADVVPPFAVITAFLHACLAQGLFATTSVPRDGHAATQLVVRRATPLTKYLLDMPSPN
jgi:hypothetical protein